MSTEFLKQISERLDKNGFKPEVVEHEQRGSKRMVVFQVPAGEKAYECKLFEKDINEELINSEIEYYNFIEGYQAIWSRANKTIECEINTAFLNYTTKFEQIFNLDLRGCLKIHISHLLKDLIRPSRLIIICIIAAYTNA